MNGLPHLPKDNLVLSKANPEDFEPRYRYIRKLCGEIQHLHELIGAYGKIENLDEVIEVLFPKDNLGLTDIRSIIEALKEVGDTVSGLYGKLLDQLRAIPSDPDTVPIMTIMASKGLDADHVYIIGCNQGNIPGNNRSKYLGELDYRNEQLRLLFALRVQNVLFTSFGAEAYLSHRRKGSTLAQLVHLKRMVRLTVV